MCHHGATSLSRSGSPSRLIAPAPAARLDVAVPLPRVVRGRARRLRSGAAAARGRGPRPRRRVREAAVSALLDVRALTKRFPVRGSERRVHAVDDVSFTIERGESVGLVGESGCGKSTLVRLVTRLLDPSDGRIVFAGRDVGIIPPAQFTHTPERRLIQMRSAEDTELQSLAYLVCRLLP